MLSQYELGRLQILNDAKRRGKAKRPKKLKCKGGQVQQGAVCKDKVRKKRAVSKGKNKLLNRVAKAAVGLGVGTAVVGVGVGLNPKLSQATKDTVTAALNDGKKKLTKSQRKEVEAFTESIEQSFPEKKKPSMAAQVAKETAIYLGSSFAGNLVGGITEVATLHFLFCSSLPKQLYKSL